MMTRYDAVYLGLAPVALPFLAWRRMTKGKYRESGPGMLGRNLPRGSEAERFAEGSIWIHAVSVGEVAAARAIEPGLRLLFPRLPFVVSTVTETGQEAAIRTIPGAEAHTYFPLDLSWNVRKFLDVFRPRGVFIMETEIWPNFITMANARGAAVFLVNGKMSERSFPRYCAARGLLRPVFDSLRGFCVQTAEDRKRFEAMGVSTDRIRVAGNCKFDLFLPTLAPEEKMRTKQTLGLPADSPVIVAGSTHETEETLILAALGEIHKSLPEVRLILAPRHPERFDRVAELVRKRGFRFRRATENIASDPQVVVLDQMGVLAKTYGVGDVAIVAGSFCPTGGHNLLEAAAHSIPVVYGPNMKSQREIAHLFSDAKAGTQVQPWHLAEVLIGLLKDPARRKLEGEKAFAVLQANQGSAQRSLKAIQTWLN